MATVVQITQLVTYAITPPPVAKVQITSLHTIGDAANVGANGYFRRNGVWVQTSAPRKVRVNGAWTVI